MDNLIAKVDRPHSTLIWALSIIPCKEHQCPSFYYSLIFPSDNLKIESKVACHISNSAEFRSPLECLD